VGLGLGLAAALLSWVVAGMRGWPLGAAAFYVALGALFTRGLHLDGLADVCDALSAPSRERRLEIMKDPRIGSFGASAVAMCLILKFAAVSRIAADQRHLWLIVPFVVSRAMQVPPLVWLPYARSGEGMARPFVEGARPVHFLVALILCAVLCGFAAGVAGLAAALGGVVVSGSLMLWMKRMFGGVTGDLVGMTSEAVEALTIAGLALAM
jgi:adenosylcobinamide-GDP ribazoletransferase